MGNFTVSAIKTAVASVRLSILANWLNLKSGHPAGFVFGAPKN